MASVRARIITAAVLWSIGLFGATMLLVGRSAKVRNGLLIVHLHIHTLLAISTLGVVFGFILFRHALASLDDLRVQLSAVRTADTRRLDGRFPAEVQPLVDELNLLLADREAAVARAVAKAGDLAHGLKTPLAILAQDAEAARQGGQTAVAAAIDAQVDRMRRQIDYHLAHARAAASSSRAAGRTVVVEALASLVRAVERVHAARTVHIDINVASDVAVRVTPQDFDEMLGNLLDNACKWTRGRVLVTAAAAGKEVDLHVDDDGAGIPEELRSMVVRRGVRIDERAAGSGFGLAIVSGLADVYGGSLRIEASPWGGVRATLRLPATAAGLE